MIYQDYDVQALMTGPLARLYCCIGNPVVGNPTQYMMEEAFRTLQLPYRYLTMNVDQNNLKEAISGLRALDFSGFNITSPFKVDSIESLDALTESASLIGAVNCVYNNEGKFTGDNTDGKGFLTSVSEVRDVSGMKVLVFGAGGAARAIICELALAGARSITIANRSVEKGRAIAESVGKKVQTDITSIPLTQSFTVTPDYDLIVQATSVGLFDAQSRLPLIWEDGDYSSCIASDVVFNPTDTRFLQEAEEKGCTTVDGLGMLVYQGAIAFTEWTGRKAPLSVMKDALVQAFTY